MAADRVLGELVTFMNSAGLRLDGILYRNDGFDTTIIHVHGSFGNFYANRWLRIMAKMYQDAGINFLSFNLSTHDGIAEAYRYQGKGLKDKFEYVGFSIVEFDSCLDDIEGAVDFVKPFSRRIILQGHSLGCDRVLHYLINRNAPYDFILIGPADSYQLQENWIAPESIKGQIARLKSRRHVEGEYDWLSIREYGIKQPPNEVYCIPVTTDALISIMEGAPFRLIRLSLPAEFSLDQRALVYMGGGDGYQTWSAEEMFAYFEKRIREVRRIFMPDSDHELSGRERDIIDEIIEWVRATTPT